MPSAPRELNLSHKDRSSLLYALSHTTHPSAFAPVLELITLALRNYSHPNFVRWSMCNGNKPRVIFLRTFAICVLTLGLIISLILILSDKSRWIRLCVTPVVWFSLTNLVAASQGLCVLLFRRNTREVHPWEISDPPLNSNQSGSSAREKKGKPSHGIVLAMHRKDPRHVSSGRNPYSNLPSPPLRPVDSARSSTNPDSPDKIPPVDIDLEALSILSGRTSTGRLEPFGPSNSYAHEPWVERWKRTTWARKLALRKIWVKEEGLRIMQNRIVLQAHAWSVLITVPLMVGIVACPQVGLY
jgi:hypothetical protein